MYKTGAMHNKTYILQKGNLYKVEFALRPDLGEEDGRIVGYASYVNQVQKYAAHLLFKC
jgi:hypothetical protein